MFHRPVGLSTSVVNGNRPLSSSYQPSGHHGGNANVGFHSTNNENLHHSKSLKTGTGGGSAKTPGNSKTPRRRALGDISNKKGTQQNKPSELTGNGVTIPVKPVQLVWNDENGGAASTKRKTNSIAKSAGNGGKGGALKPKKPLGTSFEKVPEPSFSFPVSGGVNGRPGAKTLAPQPRRRAVDFDIPKKGGASRKQLAVRFPDQRVTRSSSSRKKIDFHADVEFSAGRTWEEQLRNGDLSDDDGDGATPFPDVPGLTDCADDDYDYDSARTMLQIKRQPDMLHAGDLATDLKLQASIGDSLKKEDECALNDILGLSERPDMHVSRFDAYNDAAVDEDDTLSALGEDLATSMDEVLNSFLLEDSIDDDIASFLDQ